MTEIDLSEAKAYITELEAAVEASNSLWLTECARRERAEARIAAALDARCGEGIMCGCCRITGEILTQRDTPQDV